MAFSVPATTHTLAAYYFGAIGSRRLSLLFVTWTLYGVFLAVMPWWLGLWAESGGGNVWYYSGIYMLLTLCAFCSVMANIFNIFILIAPYSGSALHARLLRTVMFAPQSYFTTTDTGTILNRFSADMTMIDNRLPQSLHQVGQGVFRLLSQCVLLAIVQPFMAATLPFTFIALYLVQKVYLTTSRQLRFLDLETKSLVNASFLETLEGVATIRAFGWQKAFVNDNVKKLDLAIRPSYMMMCIQRWLAVVLDLIIAGLAMLVISLAVGFKGTTTGGQIGIAMNVVLQTNIYLLRLIEAWTTMETSLGAISRLRAFERAVLPEDMPGETDPPPEVWPARGAIDFDHMSAAYNASTLAVKDVSVSIAAGAKVGVCGRTGSGKSSLLLSLLRLIEVESGSVKIDDLDLVSLPRNAIRSKLITVPQDPMLVMSDTVRQNLDIADSDASDEDIIAALEKVKLWSVLQARSANTEAQDREDRELAAAMGGASSSSAAAPAAADPDAKTPEPSASTNLNATMKSVPLSQGQQQLFSLARAMLMRPTRGKVVLLDEATSSVDSETDKLMQALIREEFKEHTIITVAHRLDTIMDSDIVLVLEAGKLVEAGPPGELVEREGGKFKELYGRK
jgi:ATP-binding cassette, subfamily C (CFTR/MRP), member 1